jgi:methylmalonyl-CoA mutase N-terminal domain/subunit
VESLTDEMERRAYGYFSQIEERGGVVPAIEQGFFQREIAEASYRFEQALNEKQRIIVGVNDYVQEGDDDIEVLKITQEMEEEQKVRLAEVKRSRDGTEVARALRELENAARAGQNLVEPLLDAVRAYATEGEMIETMRQVFGGYRETAIY